MSNIARQLGAVVSKRVGVTVGIWGEPGIGKTHAARTVLEHVPCHHLTLHATASTVHIVAALPKPRTFPAWAQAQLARLERGESLEAESFVAMLVATLNGLAPFVLHLEDVHEADAERLEMIRSLAQGISRTRGVGLLVTSRAELPEPFRNHRLEPLSMAEMMSLLESDLRAEVPQDGLEYLYERTRGNPLFVLEFVRYLRRQGFLWSDGERWGWREPPEDFMPITIEALISQLTSELTASPQTRVALEARAMLPGELAPERLETIWAPIAGLEPDELPPAVAALEQGGVFNRERFTHPLFAEVTRREVSASRRKVYAARALNALERLDPVLAADYVDDADLEPAEAVKRLERAARQLQPSDPNRAAHLLGLAAERCSGPERMRLALEAEDWLQPSGSLAQRVRLARLALEAQPEDREARHRLAIALARLGDEQQVKALVSELPESERSEVRWVDAIFRAQAQSTHANEALQTWREHPELAEVPQSVTAAAVSFANLGDFQSAEAVIEKAFELPNFPAPSRALLLGTLAFICSEQGRLEEAQALHDQGLAMAQQLGDPANMASSQYMQAHNLYRLGRYQDAVQSFETAIILYDQAGIVQYGANARTVLAMHLTRLGQFTRAENLLLEAHDTLSKLSVTHSLATCEWSLGQLYLEWRPPHGGTLALKFAHDAVRHSRELVSARCLAQALPTATSVEAWAGDPKRALRLAQEALEIGSSSIEDLYALDVALAAAHEANNQPRLALKDWRDATGRTGFIEYQREAELEIARLEHDRKRGLELLEWAQQRGLGAMAVRARRYFRAAEAEPQAIARPSARLEVLGSMRILNNDQIVPSRARKRLEMLAYLLETRIAGHDEASALELVDALYPEMPEPEARKALKQLVYLNRAALGAESIISKPTGYALGAVSSDAEDFLRTGDSALWRGAYLTSLNDGWHQSVRDALTLALQSKAETLLESNPVEAARLGSILLEMEPFNVQVLRLTVSGFEHAGNRSAAGTTYREGRSRLLELGEALPETMDSFLTR